MPAIKLIGTNLGNLVLSDEVPDPTFLEGLLQRKRCCGEASLHCTRSRPYRESVPVFVEIV